MGREVVRGALEDPEVEVAGGFESDRSPLIGKSLRELFGESAPDAAVIPHEQGALAGSDCVIDFSIPAAVMSLLPLVEETTVALVIGTTGLGPEEVKAIRNLSRRHPILFSPNLSEGINALFGVMPDLLASLGAGWDAEIVEHHHRHKLDAPSGTALRLGEIVSGSYGRDLGAVARYGRGGSSGPRGEGEIGFHSIRGGGVPGEHSLILSKGQEEIVITHRVFSRSAFAQGALQGAKILVGKEPGLYTLQGVPEDRTGGSVGRR